MDANPFESPPPSLLEQLSNNKELLRRYLKREVTAAQIAAQYGYQVSYVMSTLSRLGVKRTRNSPTTYEIQRKNSELFAIRKEFRQFLAKKVKKGEFSLKKAAEVASCSERTLRRYVKKA